MQEITTRSENGVVWQPATIIFEGYEEYKKRAGEIADYINKVELTSENVKDVKKVLADARKVTDGLNKERIRIKKDILANYKGFEDQVNELIGIIDAADAKLRAGVKAIEEAEREAKRLEIIEIWNKRIGHYRIGRYFPDSYELWLTPQHLNKTMSLKKVEADMVDWLEDTEKSLETLEGMDDEYTVEYLNCLDLGTAIQAVNLRNKIRDLIPEEEGDEEEEAAAHFIIKGEKNITLTKLLLKDNNIEFKVV